MKGNLFSTFKLLGAAMRGRIEKWYPLAIGLMAMFLYYFTASNIKLPNSMQNIFSAAANLSAIAIGFLGATMAILLSISHSRVIKALKQAGKYTRLINYFNSAIKASFCLAILSFLGLVVDAVIIGLPQKIFICAWVFSLIFSGAMVYRVIDVFSEILRSAKD